MKERSFCYAACPSVMFLLNLRLASKTTRTYIVKQTILVVVSLLLSWSASGQTGYSLIFPTHDGWDVLRENEELAFTVKTSRADSAIFSIEGTEDTRIEFDSLGNFRWTPSFDFVDRVAKSREIT